MRFKILFVGSAIFWIGMMGLLIRGGPKPWNKKEFTPPVSQILPLNSEGSVEWMSIYLQGNKIGSVMSLTDTIGGGEIHLIERASMRISVLGKTQDVRTFLSAIADTLFLTKSFIFEISSRNHSLKAEGRVEGDELIVTVHTGGLKKEERFSLKDTYLPLSIEAIVAKKGFQEGDRFDFPLFDPTTLSPGVMNILVGGEETIELRKGVPPLRDSASPVVKGRLLTLTFLGIESRVWVSERGEVLREEGPMGLVMVRESEKEAQEFPSGEPVEILTLFSIPSNLEIENPRELKFMKVRLEGEGIRGLTAGDGRQRIIDAEMKPYSPGGLLLEIARGSFPKSEIDTPIPEEKDLHSTSLIQSDEDAIQEQALEIVGKEKDPSIQVELITAWVYENLEKVPTVSIPSALDVLKTREGDCNEHSILFTALARSLGIPARIAVGVVYLDGFFYYHSWNRVYLKGSKSGMWVDVDPTFGQPRADATHIKLAEGDLDRQAELANLIGRLQIEVLEYR